MMRGFLFGIIFLISVKIQKKELIICIYVFNYVVLYFNKGKN